MAGNPLIFKDAEAAKNAIMDSQKKEIAALYEDWADEIGRKAWHYNHQSTKSSVVSERQMRELQKMLRTTSKEVSNEVYSKIKKNMYTISDAVVADSIKWLESFGFSKDGLNAAFNYVPDEVVRNLITGQIYDSGWSLSKRIWGDNEQTMKDAYQIMAKGLAENKPVYEIAKELERYVRPSAKFPWNPILTMKNTKTGKIEYKRIYKKQVDYNAQRLARTLAQHSYQQSFIATTQKNPFITEYIWHSNGSRVCPLCADRDGAHFKKDELPMDHPNGMCIMEPVVSETMVDDLANWFNSPDGTYPEIDAFAGNFGYEVAKGGTVQDYINKYGTSTKNPSAWYHSLSPVQKAEAKLLKDASGLGWDEWYEKNIYAGSVDDLAAYKAKVAAKSKGKTEVVKVFNPEQEKYLKPYGFTPDKMPEDFDDWVIELSTDDMIKIMKEMNLDPVKDALWANLEKYYDANLASAKLGSKTVKVSKSDSLDPIEQFIKNHTTTETKAIKWALSLPNSEYDQLMTFVKSGANLSDIHAKVLAASTNTAAKSTVTNTVTKIASASDDAFDANSWFNKIKSQNEAHMLDLESKSMKILGEKGKNGVKKYTGNSYHEMNSYLRYIANGTDEATAIAKSGIDKMQLSYLKDAMEGMDKVKLTEDLVLRRGTDIGDLAGAFMSGDFKANKELLRGKTPEELNQMFSGAVGKLHSFTSTSSQWDRGFDGSVEVVFYAPEGAKASSIMGISLYGTAEGETLLNAGTTVKCIKVEKSDGHMGSSIRVFMEIIPG